MRHLIAAILFAAATTSLQAQEVQTSQPALLTDEEAAQTREQQLARQAFLRFLANDVMLPLTADFTRAATGLAATGRAFCDGSRTLPQLQAAWRTAQAAWQALEMLQIGPAIERRTQRQVNAWPLRPTLLAPLLEDSGPIAPARIEALGAAGKGFPALEYLLFDRAGSGGKPRAAAHCNALQALADDIVAEAGGLERDWRAPAGGFARQLAEAGSHPQDGVFASSEQALGDALNLLIAGIDGVRLRKIGKPLEKSEDGAALERIESWRAGASLDHIRDNLRGFERVFFGAEKTQDGLEAYLLQMEKPILVRNLREKLAACKRTLAAIKPPLQQAVVTRRKQVEQLYKALGELQNLLETQAADALKIEPGFNANDGD